MCQITAEEEEEIRTEIANTIQSIDNSGAVFSDVRKFEDKKEFYTVLKQFGYNATSPYVRFVQVIFLGYREEDGDLFLQYRANVLQEYFPASPTAAGSTTTFNAFIINLRNLLKASRNITESADLFGDLESDLKLDDRNEFYKNLYAHHGDVILEVEVCDC
jgi:hypothetical protein